MKAKKTKKMGRPILPKDKLRGEKISFRAIPALRAAIEKQAKRERKTLSAYIVGVLQSMTERSE